jgi:8-oxo-dGTP pyrophosphatase MutT (NUDIX family)
MARERTASLQEIQPLQESRYNPPSCCHAASTSPGRAFTPLFDTLYGLRDRATAVVRRDGLLLLVRDRGFRRFSLPGGGLRRGESPEAAVVRELEEETGLQSTSVTPLPQCRTTDIFNTYLVFLIHARGELHIDPVELSEATWWDGKERLPLFHYVRHVITMLHWPN